MERQAPEAIATAVTATCVMAEVTAPWTEPEPLAAAAMALPEARTELREEETERLGESWSRMERKRKRWGGGRRGWLERKGWNLGTNMAAEE